MFNYSYQWIFGFTFCTVTYSIMTLCIIGVSQLPTNKKHSDGLYNDDSVEKNKDKE